MKKIFTFLLLGILCITFTACTKETDASKFKKEYESLNNEENNNHKIREVSISKDNPIIYSTASEIADMIDNKETFIVYFGFPKCPWCRSMIETLLEVCKDNKISKVYYVDVYDIRDTKEVGEDNQVTTSKEGTKGYYKLIDKLDSILSDYNLTNDDGESISAGEKRIYAPNVVAVVNGTPTKLAEGISKDQEDPYQDITKDMKKEMYDDLECVVKCLNEKTTCSLTGC